MRVLGDKVAIIYKANVIFGTIIEIFSKKVFDESLFGYRIQSADATVYSHTQQTSLDTTTPRLLISKESEVAEETLFTVLDDSAGSEILKINNQEKTKYA
jgi:hypothetical protein